jgi:YidC/Oxa1 family membrane protein insertase
MGFFDFIQNSIKAMGITNLSVVYFLDIFIFTLIIKSVLLPLTIKQTKSTVKTAELQPKLKELQAKYKNDPKTLQVKQMELYKEGGVNPIAGCLPLLLQFPIFMAMYRVMYTFPGFDAKAVHVSFLWVTSYGLKDQLHILPVISGLTTYVSMLMMQPKGNDPTVKTQKNMNLFFSAFSVYIGLQFKSALVLYWIIGNLIQMTQQYFIIGRIRRREEEKLKTKLVK